MASLRGLAPPHCNTILHNQTSLSVLFPRKINQNHPSFFPVRVTQVGFSTNPGQMKSGSGVFSLKSGRRGSNNSLLEIDDFDDDGLDDEDDDFDEDDEVLVPFKHMKEWMENKPPGFGEGKVYDTSIEGQLLQEMEQSRQAQLANLNQLKNNPQKLSSKKQQSRKQKAHDDFPSGVRVRLAELPKKKNIHRDLQIAFKGVPGIVNIIPAVSGNKKTRDPICKGLAFVDFKSEDEALRFVQLLSRQKINFGKIQKQIKCEIINSSQPNPASEQLVDGISYPPLAVPTWENSLDPDLDVNITSQVSLDETVPDKYESANEEASEELEDNVGNMEVLSLLEANIAVEKDELETINANKLSLQQKKKVRGTGKKLIAKRKGDVSSKLNIPGSANRLKIREKAVLTGVFSKYGSKSASAVNE